MSADLSARNMEDPEALAAELDKHPADPSTEEGAAARVAVAKRCTYGGDYATARSALAPYLANLEGDPPQNDDNIALIDSPLVRASLLVEIGLLLNHFRKYRAASDLIQRAIALYELAGDSYLEANAYHWLAFTKLNQHDFYESEKCNLRAIELLYQSANQDQRSISSPGEVDLSYAVAASRIWLGILAQRQGQLMKAKTELYTARELMQVASHPAREIKDPRAWGDLFSTLGRVYSCEGRYAEAIEETNKAISYYAQAHHLTFELQTRINLARVHIKKMGRSSSKEDEAAAKRQLTLSTEILENKIPHGDLRTECLLALTYSWFYFACGDWALSKKLADGAIAKATTLGSGSILADCYRARADVLAQLHKNHEAREDLRRAMQYASSVSQYKTLGAVLLSFARSYCSKVDPDQVEVDKYLDRFAELRAQHPFESKYLDDLLEWIKQDRLELPSQRAFYFSIDDLTSAGYDAGLSRYLVWAMRSARLVSHGDMKKMTEALHFNTLSRTYKYDKLARAIEAGKSSAASQKINKTHTVRRNFKK